MASYHFVSPYWSEEIRGRGHMWLECASDILIGRDRASADEIREFRMGSLSNSNDVSRVWEVMYTRTWPRPTTSSNSSPT